VVLGRHREAIQWLEVAAEERSSWIVFAREDPKLASLRYDKQFYHILNSLNLPALSTSAHQVDFELQI
jgi:hypothetical protein